MKTKAALDKLIQDLLKRAEDETDLDKKLSITDRILKFRALEIKDREGQTGSAFRTEEES
jgi:hypothetical protein